MRPSCCISGPCKESSHKVRVLFPRLINTKINITIARANTRERNAAKLGCSLWKQAKRSKSLETLGWQSFSARPTPSPS